MPTPPAQGPLADRLRDPLASSDDPHEPLLLHRHGTGIESDDPAGDMMIGEHSGPAFPRADVRRSAMTSGRVGRTWLTVGVGAAAAAVALVTVLFVRGESLRPGGEPESPNGEAGTPNGPPGAPPAPGAPVSRVPTSATPANAGPGRPAGAGSAAGAALPGGAGGSAAGGAAGTASGGGPADASGATTAGPSGAAPPAASGAASDGASAQAFHVIVSGAYPFDVAMGNGVVSRARMRHELSLSGPQALRLRASQYFLDRQMNVQGAPGSVVRAHAPPLGRLTVRTAFETCQVSLGGHNLGYPPIAERPVASGTYRLTLRCADGDNQSESVTIAPGQTYVALIR